MKKYFTVFIALVALTIIVCLGYFFAVAEKNNFDSPCKGQKCNVVLIDVDTLSEGHLSGNGYFRETSPFIDDFFVNNGLVFKNAISNSTWTIPSFASMFKSKLPSKITVKQAYDTGDGDDFVDRLRGEGIEIKAVLRNQPTTVDQSVDSRFSQDEIIPASRGRSFSSAKDWLGDRAKNDSDKPFFLMIHSWDVHHPFDPPEPYRNMFTDKSNYQGPIDLDDYQEYKKVPLEQWRDKLEQGRLQYDQGIRKTDDYIKDFIENFPEKYKQNTVFILTSDHGEAFAQHENFVGHAFTPYQEVIDIPLYIREPNGGKKVVETNVSLLDMAPTILGFFGINSPESFEGEDLIKIANSKNNPRFVKSEFGQSFWLENFHGLYPANEGENLLIMNTNMVSGTNGKWKVINIEGRSLQLVDLEKDPGEAGNLTEEVDNLPRADKKIIKKIFDNLGISY